MRAARAVLARTFGYADFRPGQVDVVASVLSGADTLGVLPTGGGKSLCYQVPALVLPGLTVVISPLISLMKDQVDRLLSRGVQATLLNSTLQANEVSDRLTLLLGGKLKLLYVAPERFEASDLQRCLRRCGIALLAVDEAHCISEWGHDFRPSFRRIADVAAALGRPPLVALTATATPAVRGDIVRQLRMRRPRVIVGGFDRDNLSYAVRRCRSEDDKNRALVAILTSHSRPAIVYASTRGSVQRIAAQLCRAGIRALPYHGGLDDSRRHDVQDGFMHGDVDTIVATNAFGMGIDKPDVRLVVHYAMPGTLEAYYQEAGRAGRDGKHSHCVLLHAHRDRATHEWFIRGMYPDRDDVERLFASWRAACPERPLTVPRGREFESAIRLLQRVGAVTERRGDGRSIHVRVMATPVRIRRELIGEKHVAERSLLRGLWALEGGTERLQRGTVVDLDALPGLSARAARAVLERLRSRQFLDYAMCGAGLYLARPGAPLESFAVDWDAMTRRKAADMDKLEAMQRYAYATDCRRWFVLRYFGETRHSGRCGGCDNCAPR